MKIGRNVIVFLTRNVIIMKELLNQKEIFQ